MKLVQYENENWGVVTGSIKNIETGVSKAGSVYTKVTVTGETIEDDVEMEADLDIIFMDYDNQTKPMSERISDMNLQEGAMVAIPCRITKNDKGEKSFYGNRLSYFGNNHFYTKITDEKGNENRISVFIGRGNYASYDKEKGAGSVTVAEKRYNPDIFDQTTGNKGVTYWCNHKLNIKDKGDKKQGYALYSQFVFNKDKGETAKTGVFVTIGEPWISDKQKDKNHPTVETYNGLLSWSIIPDDKLPVRQ